MFDEFSRKLRDLQRRAEELDGESQVPVTELFPDEFMLLHTDFPSFDAMLEASGFNVQSSEDFAAIPDDAWDAHVRAHTQFSSWDEMQSTAAQEWASRRLGFDDLSPKFGGSLS
jgi:hypothetical protein